MEQSPLYSRSTGIRGEDLFDFEQALNSRNLPAGRYVLPSSLGRIGPQELGQKEEASRGLRDTTYGMPTETSYPESSHNMATSNAYFEEATTRAVTGSGVFNNASLGFNPRLVDPHLFGGDIDFGLAMNPVPEFPVPSPPTGIESLPQYGPNPFLHDPAPLTQRSVERFTYPPPVISPDESHTIQGIDAHPPEDYSWMMASSVHANRDNSAGIASVAASHRTPRSRATRNNHRGTPNTRTRLAPLRPLAGVHAIQRQGRNFIKSAESLCATVRDSMECLNLQSDNCSVVHSQCVKWKENGGVHHWPEYIKELEYHYGHIRDYQWASLRAATQAVKHWMRRYADLLPDDISQRGTWILHRTNQLEAQIDSFRFPDWDRVASGITGSY